MFSIHIFKSITLRAALLSLALPGLAGAVPLPAAAATGDGPDFGAIDSYVSKSLAGTPGFALSIVHGDQVMHVKGFGVADGNGSPVTADTPFVLGSESKPITALGIMQLKESGALDLDAPVKRYLPWFRVADPGYSAQITIRQLLNQTSGLPPSAPFETSVTSVESRVRDLATVELPASPGRLFQYSNSNYDVLGLVIETISGQSYADYMQEHVFAPLGMTHSYASESEAKRNGLATGHEWWFGLPVGLANYYRSDYIPAGWIVSSASDMSHYLIAQLNGGSYAGVQVLSAQGIAEMHRGEAKDNNRSYGLGWYDDTVSGIPVYEKDGEAVTFHTDMILVPATGWGVELIADSSSLPAGSSVNATAEGVVLMLAGRAAPFTPSPLSTYVVFDLLIIAVVGFQLWSLIRVLRKPMQPARATSARILRHMILPLTWRLALAIAASGVTLVTLGGMFGVSPRFMAETDIGSAVIVVSVLLLVNGGLRTARTYLSIRPRPIIAMAASVPDGLQEVAS